MKLGVLFSGGKDSCLALFLAEKRNNEISCLISIESENQDSYMFHTPSIKQVKKQAEALNIPLVFRKTKGEKETELRDLEKAIKEAKIMYKIEGIVTGAVASSYQKSRIKKICDNLNLKCINPLWNRNPEDYWNVLLKNKFKIIIVGVAADGLGKEWLGREIDQKNFEELKRLSQKFNFHLGFEGGEAETFVLYCPLFKRELKIVSKKISGENNSWRAEIKLK